LRLRAVAVVLSLLTALGGVPLSVAARVDYERAVERTRYQFVIGNTRPFDEVYPRSVFEKRVHREIAEERVLKNVFGLAVTPKLLDQELDRIEKSTKAPDQWEAIKKTLKNDRRLIEEVFCRPLLVDRALRAKFAFDQKIHAVPHQKAREARATFLEGMQVAGAKVVLARRKSEAAPTTEEMLGRAKEEVSVPRVLSPPKEDRQAGPVTLDPEVTAVLEKELKRPGDVTTILEERDCFEVFRLIAATAESWKLDAVRFSKVDFDSWLERQRGGRNRRPNH
jgi:hypothetical protein